MAIPKKIHQTALSLEGLAPEIRKNMARLKSLNPDWQYSVYSKAEQLDYIKAHISSADFEEVERINPIYGVVVSDLFRYLMIYNEGGVYLDLKSAAKKPLSEVLKPQYSFLISQWRNKLGEKYATAGLHPELSHVPGGEFQQWHVIAKAKHPFLKAVIDQTLYNIRTYSPDGFGVGKMGILRVSGPICYTNAIRPLLGHYPADIVDIESLGIQYSIYEDLGDKGRHRNAPGHYTHTNQPVVLREKYFNLQDYKNKSLGDHLADVVRENTDLVLKIALFSIVMTIVIFVLLVGTLFWRIVF